jgi:hypothetical protein
MVMVCAYNDEKKSGKNIRERQHIKESLEEEKKNRMCVKIAYSFDS